MVETQFGYLEFMEEHGNYEKNSFANLVFSFSLGFTPTLGGNFKI